MRRGTLLLVLVLLPTGCTREHYHLRADKQTYTALAQHMNEQCWPVARVDITPPPASRLFDPFDPDHPPMPPDDCAANFFMRWPNGMRGSRHFHDDGDAPFIEAPDWLACLPVDENGKLKLSAETAVQAGLLHSREYQTALENLYQTALTLTLNRFEFACHWIATNDTVFTQFGSSDTEMNTLSTSSLIGFTRNFAAGGQLIADFANSFVFTFSGIDKTVATSSIPITFIQPLLRGAGRWVRLDALTQAERNVLYAVRSFARFRKAFYVNLTTQGRGYLGLLLQVQNIRNLEANLSKQEENLRLHEALFAAGSVSTVQVDQAFQSYLQGKQSLLQAQAALETSLDSYKIQLGLPPRLPIELDSSLLNQFQLNSPALSALQGEVDRFFADFRERDEVPTLEELQTGFTSLQAFQDRTLRLVDDVENELKDWKVGEGTQDPAQRKREQSTHATLTAQLPDVRTDLAELARRLSQNASEVAEPRRKENWDRLQDRARQLIAALAQLFVIENQIRVYLIPLKSVAWKENDAIAYALDHRFDLMNQRARVTDTWREIHVAANALKGVANVTVTADPATKPGGSNPFDFRASASSYSVGAHLEGPLNRQAEQNAYRASLIAYQQSRRDFMALEDQIASSIRFDLRNLELERANFDIARQSLISAARQVEGAQDRLLIIPNAADTTSTVDILNALTALFQAKAGLVSSWINYENSRIQLLFDMELLQVDPRGLSPDESDLTAAGEPNVPLDTGPSSGTAGR